MNQVEKPGSVDLEFRPGKSWAVASGYQLAFQFDGNLVVSNPDKKAIWASGTGGKGATLLKMQTDGNLVIYSVHTPLWSSGTDENPGATLVIQEDGNIVIYGPATKPLWATGTNGK